jgi:SSS family solute:Na+ symporter
MTFIDISVVVAFFAVLVIAMVFVRTLSKSVADFVAANRCAGRYIICVSEGAAALGIMSFLGQFEQYYEGGFCPAFWWLMVTPMYLLITMTGWIVFRFRSTKAFTYAQFYEERYSRNFRIFTGIAGFLALLTLYGIAPAILSRFLISFVGLPEQFQLFSITVPTYPALIVVALIIPTLITMLGGQITVMVTDFLQGQIFQVTLVLATLFLLFQVDWADIVQVYSNTTGEGSFVNPFKQSATDDFSAAFFVMWILFAIYCFGMGPNTQGYQASAMNPHESRMSRVWSILRNIITVTLPFFLPIVAYVVLHHEKYSELAAQITPTLQNITNESVRSQVRTPVFLTNILPPGLKGLFLVSAIATAITTDSTLMQALGTLFTQDIVLPIRGKRFTPKMHMLLLRGAMLGVAIIVFFFSLYFPQNDFLWMYMIQAIGIYLSGVGIVTIGGLYWKKGSLPAAWTGMLTGITISLSLFITRIVNPDFFLNGMECTCISAVFATVVYISVSLLKPANIDLDELLNHEISHKQSKIKLFAKQLFQLPEGFDTFGDKFLGWLVRALTLGMLGTFAVITIYNLTIGLLSDKWWFGFWKIYLFFIIFLAIVFTLWLLIGGIGDFRRLVKLLRAKVRNAEDDGYVEKGKSEELNEPKS